MQEPIASADDQQAESGYLFIVARDRPDILQRAQARFQGDPRIEVITDRRQGERRTEAAGSTLDRRRSDRRRPPGLGTDLHVYPNIVVQKRRVPYTELQDAVAALSQECAALRADNDRLRHEVATLTSRLEAWTVVDVARKTEVAAALAEAERALSGMRDRAALEPPAGAKLKDPHLRSA